MAIQPRPWVAGYYQINLDGIDVGIVQKVGGGNIKAEVAKIPQSTLHLIKNQIGNITYEDFNLQCGLAMGQPFKDWVKASLDSAHIYKNGDIQQADFNRKVQQIREFKNALITEVGFPAADAAAKDVAYLSVKFAVENTRLKPGGGEVLNKPNNMNQTMFRPENFRLTIDGLEQTCAKVSKVDALTVKQTVARDNIGDARDYELIAGKLEMPNLKITFNENVVEPVANWHQTFVIDGKNDVSQEKNGRLEFLSADRSKVLLALEFKGLGIFNLSRGDATNNDDKLSNCTAEMYCDEVNIPEWLA
jgi:hypothetical protein